MADALEHLEAALRQLRVAARACLTGISGSRLPQMMSDGSRLAR